MKNPACPGGRQFPDNFLPEWIKPFRMVELHRKCLSARILFCEAGGVRGLVCLLKVSVTEACLPV